MSKVWLCASCDFSVVGTDADAHKHHHDRTPDAQMGTPWGHWIYEFDGEDASGEPTGRQIHTSDSGGYYLDDHHTAEEAWRHVVPKGELHTGYPMTFGEVRMRGRYRLARAARLRAAA